MQIVPVNQSNRLFSISHAISQETLDKINSIDWLAHPYKKDDHWVADSVFRRRVLDKSDLQHTVDLTMQTVIGTINNLCKSDYKIALSSWYLCEPGFQCDMHTDGQKPNVLIMYWITPGQQYGTTFYNSRNWNDIHHEFYGIPNTGFFANYEPEPGSPWPEMWHAAMLPVPPNTYRLMTLYQLHR